MNKVVACFADSAPKAVGPYCHCTIVDGRPVYISGQLPLNPKTMTIESTSVIEQAKQSLRNLECVLLENNITKENVAKTTIFITDMADFSDVNLAYSEFFGGHKPARSCVAVKQLPLDALVEIEAIAIL